jgi:hypothetical protein
VKVVETAVKSSSTILPIASAWNLRLQYVTFRVAETLISCSLYMCPMALRSLKNLDLPQDRFPFVSSPSLPSPATNSHLSKIFLRVIKPSHFGPHLQSVLGEFCSPLRIYLCAWHYTINVSYMGVRVYLHSINIVSIDYGCRW